MNKVILISIDGMRPDGLTGCGNPYVKELETLSRPAAWVDVCKDWE